MIVEMVALLVIGVLTWFGVGNAVQGVIDKASSIQATEVRTAAEVQAAALRAYMMYAGGLLVLAIGRLVSLRRGNGSVNVPFLIPAVAAAAGMGTALQMGYGDAIHKPFWPGPDFALGFLIAGALGGVVMLLGKDPVDLTRPLVPLLPPFMIAVFVALAFLGQGTEEGDDALINFYGFQPIEIVKIVFVVYLAHYFGQRAAKLRHQRDRFLGLSFPRRRLLLPALLVFVLLFASFVLINDLGPMMILSLVFLVMFYAATRAGGWVVAAVLTVCGLVWLAAQVPAIANSPKVELRINMWLDPWMNGLRYGDQGALGRWAIAAGYLWGQGLGYAPPTSLPAGHTDLAQAHLAEELGTVGWIVYILCVGGIALQGLWVAIQNRTPERMLLATGLAVLLIAQWFVIFAGTTGLLPLTGVVAPFLSYGKTSMIMFVILAAAMARLAESGAAREFTHELIEVRKGSLAALTGTLALIAVGIGVATYQGVVTADETSVRGAVTMLARDPGQEGDYVVHKFDPRLEILANRIPRGEILDRNGQLLVGTGPDGTRVYPLGDMMGTVIGPPEGIILRPEWMLERQLDNRLRGFPDLPDGPAVWLAGEPAVNERKLFVVPSQVPKPEDRARAESMAAKGEIVRLLPLPKPDWRPLLPLLRAGGTGRDEELKRIAADVKSRQVRTTIDVRLQKAAAEAVREAAQKTKVRSAAAVMIDVDTGQVLARAQWPDYNPGDPEFQKRLRNPAAFKDKKFSGMYGPWPDKTGIKGIFQAGSITKIFTSIAAAREGLLPRGTTCLPTAGPRHPCTWRDALGPAFTRPGWYKALHDHPEDDPHGHPDLIEGLKVSCNVYFGQLGLQLGPDPLKRLAKDGLEIGWGGEFDPGPPGHRDLASTAFGQNQALMSVGQAARMVATAASGGVYRKCPPSMALDAKCEEKKLIEDPAMDAAVLSGLHQVMLAGTGARQWIPLGVRVYGKTGTADAFGLLAEKPFNVQVGTWDTPNSWFVAFGERFDQSPCNPNAKGRIAVAIVVPRAGKGAVTAGPAALKMIKAAADNGYFGELPKGEPIQGFMTIPLEQQLAAQLAAQGATVPAIRNTPGSTRVERPPAGQLIGNAPTATPGAAPAAVTPAQGAGVAPATLTNAAPAPPPASPAAAPNLTPGAAPAGTGVVGATPRPLPSPGGQ